MSVSRGTVSYMVDHALELEGRGFSQADALSNMRHDYRHVSLGALRLATSILESVRREEPSRITLHVVS